MRGRLDASAFLETLPAVMRSAAREASPMRAIAEAAASMLAPVDDLLGSRERIIDPLLCDARWLPMLAHWLRLPWMLSERGDLVVREGVARAVLQSGYWLAQRRGTATAIERLLAVATEDESVRVTMAPAPAFHAVISLGVVAAEAMDLVTAILQHELPAHLTYEFREPDPVQTDAHTEEG